jgi:hypothetical protein
MKVFIFHAFWLLSTLSDGLVIRDPSSSADADGRSTVLRGGIKSSTAGINSSRRRFFDTTIAAVATTVVGLQPAPSMAIEGVTMKGNMPDLPPETVRSYLQYRMPLQTSADFYLFELRDQLSNTADWGEVGELFQVNGNRGQGSPSRIEREFTNVFRILGLSFPPDAADDMRAAQFRFEAASAKISKATAGIRRDLPVAIDPLAVPQALAGWEEGRSAINDCFKVINDVTGLNEMTLVPAQEAEYGRSRRRYVELKKKIKLCQNRGGPTLAAAWGNLMVSGYLQDSCGIPDLDDYFYQ